VYLISALLVLIGISAILLFGLTVLQDEGIQLALDWTAGDDATRQPSVVLAFLERFGLIVPGLILYLGVFFTLIGIQLRKGHVRTAQWARMGLLWLSIGLAALILLNVYNLVRTATLEDETVTLAEGLWATVPALIGSLFTGGVWYWLNQNIDRRFRGEDLLTARETRLAWNLLIPTMTIFILVAARPLEQTFIRSLTDKRFAGNEVPQFVGFDNYTELLTIRLDTVPCRIDDDTGACSIRDNGAVRWESIDRELLREGYRTVWNLPVPFVADRSVAISGRDPDFLEGVVTTVTFAVVSVSLELTIGLFMALVVNSSFQGRGLMRAVMLIPWAIPTVISARLWELMLKDTSAGIVNRVLMDLQLIDMPHAWLSDPSLQLPTAIIVDVWKTAPFMALLLLAGLQTIPKDLYEAASVDGASPVRRFFSITLPLLRPAIAIALIFRTLDALRVFDLFNVLFGRQQLSMATYNFETLVSNQLDGYASAISVIIFIIISIFAFLYVRMLSVNTETSS
jgi:trehalose/maltose transport system permease protein